MERRLLVKAWFLLLGVGAALRCLPLPRVQALLRRLEHTRAIEADRTAWIVGAAARHQLWTVSCLERSLVLQSLLDRRTLRTELRIGVRLEDGELRAHAWVEVDGRPLGEAPNVASRFRPFAKALPG
jgi:hypothetical protein